ncbi:type II secretory pathway, pullulanase PulA and related glycosidases [Methylobacterium aquaticum]|uniref:Type II secretory pathway, pullulanase PulA and related glycosidases n=1 Tax=Methylobacterium aquaticum TaxID=270351 RepID=A0A0C6FTL9_9HYPH|nr:type II secretory pathway, pullulanase PulA and related glycosidases [Methylobacterium aquaticum]
MGVQPRGEEAGGLGGRAPGPARPLRGGRRHPGRRPGLHHRRRDRRHRPIARGLDAQDRREISRVAVAVSRRRTGGPVPRAGGCKVSRSVAGPPATRAESGAPVRTASFAGPLVRASLGSRPGTGRREPRA